MIESAHWKIYPHWQKWFRIDLNRFEIELKSINSEHFTNLNGFSIDLNGSVLKNLDPFKCLKINLNQFEWIFWLTEIHPNLTEVHLNHP